MRVLISELQEGCILIEDVYSKSNRPIMKKKTVLTKDLIDILNLFLIPYVEVDPILINSVPFDEALQQNKMKQEREISKMFLTAVQEYKSQFKLWQSGIPVNIVNIREILLPLLEKMEENPSEVFYLSQLSNNQEYLFQHAVALGLISSYIARRLGYPKGEMIQVGLAGLLADCGMSKISQSIINKTTTLNEKEFEEIKSHTTKSYKMVRNISILNEGAKVSIIQHHERVDGSGYIFGLNGNEIHKTAKILAVADTYHAMTSERLYRRRQSPFKVIELMRNDYFGNFDLLPLQALEDGLMGILKNSKIRLSNNRVGDVIYVNTKEPTRPIIKLMNTEEIINLIDYRNIYIEEVL